MIDYRSAQAVASVIKTGSFERAAVTLNVTPSAVSQRVKQLEQLLGVALVVRGNPCRATPPGEHLFRHIEQVGLLENELAVYLPELISPQPLDRQTIPVAVNPELVGPWSLEAITLFTQHSSFLVDISISDDAKVKEKLRLGEVLAAITVSEDVVERHRAVSLGRLRCVAVATPNFMKQYFADEMTPETLIRAPGLVSSERDALTTQWIELALGSEVPCPAHRIPALSAILQATIAGMGWSLLPAHLVMSHLASGVLVEVIPDQPLLVPVLWQVNGIAATALASLTENITTLSGRVFE